MEKTSQSVIDQEYQVIKKLGQGLESDVYLVKKNKDLLALKLFKPEMALRLGQKSIEHFKAEFFILKQLNHPGICQLGDFGFDTQSQRHYFTSEYISGTSLLEACQKSDFQKILQFLIQSLRTLSYLHERKIYHSDIKPENILVNESGQVKIIDFGLANLKVKKGLYGTPAYMAPEIIFQHLPDARSDLYSLGVSFYECLLGVNPFRSPSLKDTLDKQQNLIPSPLIKIKTEIPEFFSSMISHFIQKNPSERPLNAKAALRELQHLSGGNIEIETEETLLSYLPNETQVIGRQTIIKKFHETYNKVFEKSKKNIHEFFFVWGSLGLGKTRLLEEFKFISQLSGIKTLTLNDARFDGNIDEDVIIIFDNASEETLGALSLHLNDFKHKCLVLAALEKKFSYPKGHSFELLPFNDDEIKEYLTKVTGLLNPPETLIYEFKKRTMGVPLFVTQLTRELIVKRKLFNPSGRWSLENFEDLGINFQGIESSESMKDYFSLTLSSLDQSELELLRLVALRPHGSSADELQMIIGHASLQEDMLALLEKDLIERKAYQYKIANPMLLNFIIEVLDEQAGELHEKWANLFKNHQTKDYLFHFGRCGNSKEHAQALLDLSELASTEEKLDEALEQLDLACTYPNQDLELYCNILLMRGTILEKLNQHESALECFDQIRKNLDQITNKEENQTWKIKTLESMGIVYLRSDHLEKAKECFLSGLALIEEEKDKRYYILYQNYLGRVKIKEGNLSEAKDIFEKTYDLWETLSKENKKDTLNNDLGIVYLNLHETEQAIKIFNKELLYFQSINKNYLIARTQYNLGDTYFQIGDAQKSIEYFKLCAEISQEGKIFELLFRAYNGLGNAYNSINDPLESLHYYKRALIIAEKTQDFRSEAAIAINMGIIFNLQENLAEAVIHLQGAINVIKQIHPKKINEFFFQCRALLELGEIFIKQKKLDSSRDMLRDALNLAEEHEALKGQLFWIKLSFYKLYLLQKNTSHAEAVKAELLKLSDNKDFLQEISKIESIVKNEIEPESNKTISTPPHPNPENKVVSQAKERKRKRKNMQKDNYLFETEYEKLLSLIKMINSERNLDFVLKTILHHSLELSGAERGILLLMDDDELLEVKAWINIEIDENLTEISHSIAEKVLQSGKTIQSDNACEDGRFNEFQSVALLGLRSILCLPIHARNKTVGILYLDNKFQSNAFDEDRIPLIEAFCAQAGIAIDNARLITKLEEAQQQLKNKLEKVQSDADHFQQLLNEGGTQAPTRYSYKNIIAHSQAMHEIFKLMDKITDTHLAVFIHGETGSGKELIAKALHYNNSSRQEKRFMAINCGAIPENLIESELFGHKAGAFTGANKDKKGILVEASGGTLFLDEIGDLDLNLQVKLLRVLEEGELSPLGATQTIKVDLRVVCASHKNIETLVEEGSFREDLYYRLCQIKLELPPLRERTEDIPALVEKFVENYCKQHKHKQIPKISPSFLKELMDYSWPGNVRELENIVQVSCALSDGKTLKFDSLPNTFLAKKEKSTINKTPSIKEGIEVNESPIDEKNIFNPHYTWNDYEQRIYAKAHQCAEFNPQETARLLKVSPATVYKKIKEFRLNDNMSDLYKSDFHYQKEKSLREYLENIILAAHKASGEKPYTAMKWLGVSQGHYYKVLKSAQHSR